MTYVALEQGLIVDDDSGEIIDSAGIDDPLKFSAERRHAAKEQVDEWTALLRNYDRVLLASLEGKVAYGDIVVSVRSGSYTTFHPEHFAAEVEALELTQDELRAAIGAAKGFESGLLPDVLQRALDLATERRQKRPWIESSIARKVAPRLGKVEQE